MDTSEQYIKMCDCPEIQDAFDEWNDDVILVCFVCRTRYGNCIYHPPEAGKNELDHRMIKLPRQDQLQEMVPSPIAGTAPSCKMISELNHFYDYWDTNGIPVILTTWEQLWLAFVMKEEFNKTWDGEKWN